MSPDIVDRLGTPVTAVFGDSSGGQGGTSESVSRRGRRSRCCGRIGFPSSQPEPFGPTETAVTIVRRQARRNGDPYPRYDECLVPLGESLRLGRTAMTADVAPCRLDASTEPL
jgi:hypothetical protein